MCIFIGNLNLILIFFYFLDEENTEINLTCVICLEVDSATVVLRPCNHQCVCKTCWNVLKEKQPLCPMCRSVVISTLII